MNQKKVRFAFFIFIILAVLGFLIWNRNGEQAASPLPPAEEMPQVSQNGKPEMTINGDLANQGDREKGRPGNPVSDPNIASKDGANPLHISGVVIDLLTS